MMSNLWLLPSFSFDSKSPPVLSLHILDELQFESFQASENRQRRSCQKRKRRSMKSWQKVRFFHEKKLSLAMEHQFDKETSRR